MADARENLQEAQRRRSNERESRSMEETKERTPGFRHRESWRRSDERYEADPRSWAEKRGYEYSGQIRDYTDSYADIRENLQQQRRRDGEMQERRSHEADSRFLQQKKREYEYSGPRVNEAVQIRDHNESYAGIRENLQQHRLRDAEMQQRRSYETESRFQQEKKGQALDSRVKIMNKNFAVDHYDNTESIQISHKKGDEDERQNSIESRPEKRAKTIPDSRERFEDLEKGVDIPKNLSVDAQDTSQEQIEKQRREADQDNLQQQSNDETEAHDQENTEQKRDIERKGREIRCRLDQFFNRQKKKKEQLQAQPQQEMKFQQQQEFTQEQQQESPPPPQQQHQSLVSQFHLYPLVEKLTDAIETGTRDTNSDALVTELSIHFNKSQQLLNSISGSKTMTVSGEKRKLEESEKLLQQRRDLIVEYRKSIEDIEP